MHIIIHSEIMYITCGEVSVNVNKLMENNNFWFDNLQFDLEFVNVNKL